MEPRRGRVFVPILAGATLRERVIACTGALLGIAVTGLVCALLTGGGVHHILIVAPLGASAVLLFAVPASPLAQPWPIIGGNTISALVGLAVGHWIDEPAIAVGLAVSLAIIVMSFLRCLHPPGGAAALTAVLGGPVVTTAGLVFPLVPVGLNSLILVALG
ncbi:MAG: HPP family protein, partial [Deltaproteobacteria bacterium]|nr:HPP family protein [Deltaproteobacteria bacterium]